MVYHLDSPLLVDHNRTGGRLKETKDPVNTLPNNKTLVMTKLKECEGDEINVAKMIIALSNKVENTMGKGENAGNRHCLLFPQGFPKPSSSGSLKVGIMW